MQSLTTLNLYRRHFNIRLLTLCSAIFGSAQTAAKSSIDVLLAMNAPANIDPAGYLVSEKLDGVRALWDGSELRFRSGLVIPAPAWFIAKLPKIKLDGELWIARGTFDALSSTVRQAPAVDARWQKVKFMVFELPDAAYSALTFEQRYSQLQTIVRTAEWPQLQAVAQTRVLSSVALQALLKETVRGGGEGLMLHLAQAPISVGRSDFLLKLKPMHDAEATVVGHIPGKGKYTGLTGALDVQTLSGQRFKLGTGLSDAQRQSPPAIGNVVTYSYRELTPSGKPRFASFLRETH